MRPHGGYKHSWPEDYGGLSRTGAKRAADVQVLSDYGAALYRGLPVAPPRPIQPWQRRRGLRHPAVRR